MAKTKLDVQPFGFGKGHIIAHERPYYLMQFNERLHVYVTTLCTQLQCLYNKACAWSQFMLMSFIVYYESC